MSTKVSAYTDGVTANATDDIPVARAGANRRIRPDYLATYTAAIYGLRALCTTSADTTYASGSNRINFDTKTFDPGSAVTVGASWVYTVPETGYYRVEVFNFDIDANSNDWGVGAAMKAYLYKSTSTLLSVLDIYQFQVATTRANVSDVPLAGAAIVPLTAAETIHVKMVNAATNTRKLFAGAWIAISRVA